MDRILIIRYHSSFGGDVKNADLFADFRLLEHRKALSKNTGQMSKVNLIQQGQNLFVGAVSSVNILNSKVEEGDFY